MSIIDSNDRLIVNHTLLTYQTWIYPSKFHRCCLLNLWLLCRLRSWKSKRRFSPSGPKVVEAFRLFRCPRFWRFDRNLQSEFWFLEGWRPLLIYLFHDLSQKWSTFKSHQAFSFCYVVYFTGGISTSSCQPRPCCIECQVKNLITMPFEDLETFTHPDIPQSASPINRSRCTVLSCKFKLSAWNLFVMTHKLMNWISDTCIPDDGSFIEGTCQNKITIWVEM